MDREPYRALLVALVLSLAGVSDLVCTGLGLVAAFARRRAIGKLFLEPHLKSRWRLGAYDKIRFHGCKAVRHDDHLHIQL